MAEGGDVAAAALSSTTIEKAVRELNEPEDPEKKLAAIKELRLKLEEWQQTEGTEAEFTLTRVEDDKFLLRFLRTKKFDVERASTLFVNYHKYRHKHAPLLGELTPQAAQATMSNGMMSVLPGRSKDGCRVLVVKLSEWDPDKLTPGDMMKMMLVVMDRLLEDDETQVNGITVIEDMDEMSFFQVIKMAQMEHIQKGFAIELIQEALPARFKGVHIVNQPWYVSIILSIVKPFMKQKLRERIHFYGMDYEGLHNVIPPEHLPEQYGGQLPSLQDYAASSLFPELPPLEPKTVPSQESQPKTEETKPSEQEPDPSQD